MQTTKYLLHVRVTRTAIPSSIGTADGDSKQGTAIGRVRPIVFVGDSKMPLIDTKTPKTPIASVHLLRNKVAWLLGSIYTTIHIITKSLHSSD